MEGEVSESRIKEEGGGEIKGSWLDGKEGGKLSFDRVNSELQIRSWRKRREK